MAEGEKTTRVGAGDSLSQMARPAVEAILESQPVPAFFVGADGSIMPNSAARRFVTKSPKGTSVYAHDGTDLWTVLTARSDEANPFFDVRLRLREDGGGAVDVSMTVVPVRGRAGALSGAVVFLLSIPSERIRTSSATGAAEKRSQAVVKHLAQFTGADAAYILEFDTENPSQARVRASWPDAGGTPREADTLNLRNSPSSSYGGRKTLTVPSGLAAAYPEADYVKGFEAYAGVALIGDEGEQIGCLAAMWRSPLQDPAGTSAVLSIMSLEASRALREDIAHRELMESEQRYGAVFEGSAIPVLLIEPSTTQIVDANPAASEFYGYPYQELLLMSILQVDALSPDALQAELERAAGGARGHFVAQHILSGGRLRDVEVSIGPIMVIGRRLLYCMISDITERKRIEAELDRSRRSLELVVGQRTEDLLRANAELQQASMSRDLVIGSMAQEVRMSLGNITGFTSALLENPEALSAEQRSRIEMVHQEGERLEAFVFDLESRRKQEKEHPRSEEEFDLVSLVESVSLGLASFAEDKGLRLRFAAEQRPMTVCTDRYKVQQILLNLLSNAIRYTETGGVTVTVGRGSDGGVDVRVSDTGSGIDRERLERLFDQPEANEAKAGIGLPASQQLASVLGGVITVDSTPGKGSTFTLRLPAEDAVADE